MSKRNPIPRIAVDSSVSSQFFITSLLLFLCSWARLMPKRRVRKLIHTESVGEITITSFVFGGPAGCDTATGAGCTFYDLGASVKGQNTPLGPYNSTVTGTVLLAATRTAATMPMEIPPNTACRSWAQRLIRILTGSTISSAFQGTSCCATASCNGGAPRVKS